MDEPHLWTFVSDLSANMCSNGLECTSLEQWEDGIVDMRPSDEVVAVASVGEDPFAEGWLTDQLGKVVQELEGRATLDRPQLTGGRARAISSSAWISA